MGRINPLVCIGIPTWGTVSVAWAGAYRHLGGMLGASFVEIQVYNKPIAEARNELMRRAIENHADFIFMLGDDVLPPGDVIHKLWTRMQADPEMDLATGIYWTKTVPTHPYIWRGIQRGPYLDWKMGEFFDVDFAGCDCLLIRLSDRIKALGPEWFSTTWAWEPGQMAPVGLATEDFYFYTRARRAGAKLYADTGVQCLHEDRQTRQLFGLLSDMPQAGAPAPSVPEGGLKVADIGAGISGPYWGDGVQVDRFDGDEKARPTYRCDLRSLPVPDQSYDIVHARHVLEHFGRAEVPAVLHEWLRILKVGGRLELNVPNLAYAARRLLEIEDGAPFDQYVGWQFYGEQATAYDYHKIGFTPRLMRGLLEQIGGLEDIVVGAAQDGMNIGVTATKHEHREPLALMPVWDEIMQREDVVVEGLRPVEVTPEYGGETATGNGRVPDMAAVGG